MEPELGYHPALVQGLPNKGFSFLGICQLRAFNWRRPLAKASDRGDEHLAVEWEAN